MLNHGNSICLRNVSIDEAKLLPYTKTYELCKMSIKQMQFVVT